MKHLFCLPYEKKVEAEKAKIKAYREKRKAEYENIIGHFNPVTVRTEDYLQKYSKSYENELKDKKAMLEDLKRHETFATVTGITDNSVDIILGSLRTCLIPLDEFALCR